ncbi:MAG: YitT family protein [Bacillota bacterium]
MRKIFFTYTMITLGSLFTAVGLDMFLVPNRIAAGGVSGLATLIFHIMGFPVGLTMLAINIPLFLASLRILGTRFGMKTLYGFFSLSVFVDIMEPFITSPTQDPLLASVYGGVLTGIGLGIVFRSGGTTGGTDLAAQLLLRYVSTSSGQALLIIDGLVILLAAFVFSAELALYALISVFISSRVIDAVQEGVGYGKAAFIISDYEKRIAQGILNDMERGATFFDGKGAYSLKKKGIILTVVSRSEVTRLKNLVSGVDPDAFVIVTSVNEVLGEGFKETER